MKRKIILLFCAALMLSGCGQIATLSNGDEAVVSFSSDDMSSDELLISVNDLYEALKDDYASSVLVDMIDKKIFELEYADDIQDASDYADEQLESTKEQFVDDDGNYDEDSLISALYSYLGLTSIDQYWNLLYLGYYESLATTDYAKTLVTTSEIKDYYKNNIVGDISCSHILITPDVTDEMDDDEVAEAEAEAEALPKEII